MADGIEMTYSQMDEASRQLLSIVEEIKSNKQSMIEQVNFLCETWRSAASVRHQEEFETVGKSIDQLSDMANELINSIKHYRADMEELDNSYA